MTIREEMHSVAQEIVQSYEDRGTRIAQLRLDVGARLRGVRADLSQTVSGQLKASDSAHATMSRQLRDHLAQAAHALEDNVGTMLHGFHQELAGARQEWGKLAATMRAKRRGMATPQMAGQDNRVFRFLANHPNGTRMTELEQEFGMPRIQMAKVLRGLMDENKAKKQGLLYFAI